MTPLELLDETISIRVRKNGACSKGQLDAYGVVWPFQCGLGAFQFHIRLYRCMILILYEQTV